MAELLYPQSSKYPASDGLMELWKYTYVKSFKIMNITRAKKIHSSIVWLLFCWNEIVWFALEKKLVLSQK